MPRLTKPRAGEPIRLTTTTSGEPRYQVVLTTSARGAVKRQQTRKNFRTLADARAYVDRTRTDVREGVHTTADATTLATLADQWLSTRRDIRAVSLEGYRQVLKPVLAAHGDRRVQSLTPVEIGQWVDTWRVSGGVRGRGLSHRSVVYTLGAVRQVLDHGVLSGVLRSNPAARVKAPRKRAEDRSEVEVWPVARDAQDAVTVPDLARFLAHVDTLTADPGTRAGLWLTAAGLRRSEVLGLDWSAVDLAGASGTVQVRQSRVKVGRGKVTATDDPKSRASRRLVVLHPGARAALRVWWLAQGRPESGLVVVDAAGQGVHPDAYGDRFREECRAAGVPVIRLHAVRHTIATAMHETGEPPAAVARYLGHELATHLAYYVKSTDASAAHVAARFGSVLGVAVGGAVS